MTTQNGTIDGVSLASGNPEGVTALDSTTVYTRKCYVVTAHFPAYTGSSDTMTLTGILTAINSSCRDGRTRVLRWAAPAFPGIDAAGQGVHAGGASVAAGTIANPTTTGDMTGNLTDASGSELTSTTGTTVGLGIIVGVDETPGG